MHLVRVKSCARVVYQPFNNHTTSNREVRRNAMLHFCVAQVLRFYMINLNSQVIERNQIVKAGMIYVLIMHNNVNTSLLTKICRRVLLRISTYFSSRHRGPALQLPNAILTFPKYLG